MDFFDELKHLVSKEFFSFNISVFKMVANLVLKRLDNRNCRNSEGSHKYFEKQKMREIVNASFLKVEESQKFQFLQVVAKIKY